MINKLLKNKQKGAAMLVAVMFFLFASTIFVLGVASPVLKQAAISKNIIFSKGAYYLSEGSLEEIYYRIKTNKQLSSTESLTLNGGTANTVISNTFNGKTLIAEGNSNSAYRKAQMDVLLGTGVSFHYGIQSGKGGFYLDNSSSIVGNVFSAGSIVGTNNNMIYGDVISAGNSGNIYGIHATGTAYAHTIGKTSPSTTVDKNAYYQSIVNTNVSGTLYPNSPDQDLVALPISDEQISQWESDASSGGTISSCDSSGNYTITTSISLGPKKITCNLIVKSSSGVLTVTGPLWITGNITFQTGPTIKMSPSLGSSNVAIIADNPNNKSGSGIISVGQTTIFEGSGSAGSYVFLISQNNSAENGGALSAISMSQGASALVAYASHGQITLSQSVSVKEVTAYKINLSQSANVTYDTGLASVLFQSGPSGGYSITRWKEIQ